MPAAPSSRARLAVIAGVAAVVVAIVVIVVATDGEDSSSGTATTVGPGAIESPATVTGITDASGEPSVITSGIGTDSTLDAGAAAIGTLQRALDSPGAFDCTTTGTWRPFAELQLAISVGEPAAGSGCTGDVIDLPFGYCSPTECIEVPADWTVRTRSGVAPETLVMIVAPNTASTAEYVCVRDLVPQPKQILLSTTTIEQACLADSTSASIDLPYIPPDTSDIYVPPPASVDLPAG